MYTIALLPSKKVQKQIVAFTKKHQDYFSDGFLNMRNNRPHVTLLKTAFKADTDLNALLNLIVEDNKNTLPSGVLQGLKVNYRSLIAGFSNDKNITNLHNIILPHVKPLVDKTGIKNKKFVGPTVDEIESYFKYGYRYTGDKFFSHLTLGRLGCDDIPYELEKEFEKIFLGKEIEFNRIVICRGVKNILGPVIASKKLTNKILFIS